MEASPKSFLKEKLGTERDPPKVQENRAGSWRWRSQLLPHKPCCGRFLSKTRRQMPADNSDQMSKSYSPETHLRLKEAACLGCSPQVIFPPCHFMFYRLCDRCEKTDKISFNLHNHPVQGGIFHLTDEERSSQKLNDLSQLHG